MFSTTSSRRCSAVIALASTFALGLGSVPASAEALLLIEASSGKVLHAENATYPWYPASVTKMMTLYVTLRALKENRIKLDQLFTVTENAVAQQPSKMGFKAGTQLTVDNTMKMMMVKSANDMAVVLAEGVSGSIDNFSNEMNQAARRLGMTQTTYVNPNGLPADQQITSARDLAILARALIREFPEYDLYWHIPAIKLGKRVMRNTNRLIDSYPGADGMKTGFICASGFNLVGVATRNGRRLIAVVMGAHSGAERAEHAAQLLESGFNSSPMSWLMPSLGSVESLAPVNAEPLNLKDEMCGPNRRRHGPMSDDDNASSEPSSAFAAMASGFKLSNKAGAALLGARVASMPPIPVFIGPGKGSTKTDIAGALKRDKLAAVQNAPSKTGTPPPATDDKVGAKILPTTGFTPTNPAGALAFTSTTHDGAVDPATAATEAAVPLPRARPKRHSRKR